MTVSELAVQRDLRRLQAFCKGRSGPQAVLSCRREDGDLLIEQNGQALLRLRREHGRWRVDWRREDGRWTPWPLLSHCEDIDTVIGQLEQAPLHVHW